MDRTRSTDRPTRADDLPQGPAGLVAVFYLCGVLAVLAVAGMALRALIG